MILLSLPFSLNQVEKERRSRTIPIPSLTVPRWQFAVNMQKQATLSVVLRQHVANCEISLVLQEPPLTPENWRACHHLPTYCGWTTSCTTWKPRKTMFISMYKGTDSFQGFLGSLSEWTGRKKSKLSVCLPQNLKSETEIKKCKGGADLARAPEHFRRRQRQPHGQHKPKRQKSCGCPENGLDGCGQGKPRSDPASQVSKLGANRCRTMGLHSRHHTPARKPNQVPS